MVKPTGRQSACLSAVWVLLAIAAGAQQGPIAAMFAADQKRDQALAPSFLPFDVPSSKSTGAPLKIYLSAGDLERAFDRPEFRPDAAIVPTNTDLALTATSPATQRVLTERVRKHADVMRDLEQQAAARRKQTPASPGKDPGVLRIAVDTFLARLSSDATSTKTEAAFPRLACFVPTDFANGGAIDRRDLFTQDRVRTGIAACLKALDAEGVHSVVMPLMGAASSGTESKDTMFEGQRILKECRLVNAVAGIGLGIHDFAPGRQNIHEIGIVQWDQEIAGMFSVPKGSRAEQSAKAAYRTYAEQIQLALRKGVGGEKTTSSDVDGSCTATFNAQ
jgi:hypothetical protein